MPRKKVEKVLTKARVLHCSSCGLPGHNRMTCTTLAEQSYETRVDAEERQARNQAIVDASDKVLADHLAARQRKLAELSEAHESEASAVPERVVFDAVVSISNTILSLTAEQRKRVAVAIDALFKQ